MLEGEEVSSALEASQACRIILTNRRVIIWERKEDVENIIPIRIEDILGVELKEEKASLSRLLLSVALCIFGACLLPQLIIAWSNVSSIGQRLSQLLLGLLGIGLLIVGFLLLSAFLSQLLFPTVELVFKGSPEARVIINPEARRKARELMRQIQSLKMG